MYTRVAATGSPIGTDPSISVPALITWQQVNVVFSVGPYPLINRWSELIAASARST